MTEPLVVGQELYFVPSDLRWRSPSTVRVTKIGRRWAYIDRGYDSRIDKETWVVDGHGYGSPGRCYRSEADWRSHCRRTEAWFAIRKFLAGYGPIPDRVTLSDLERVAEILGVPLEKIP